MCPANRVQVKSIDVDMLKVLRKKEKISIIVTKLKGNISGFF